MAASDFIHRIGPGSTYDIDMDFTENLVKSFKYPKNEIYQYIVYTRYMADAYSYFTKVEEYINSDQPLIDLKRGADMNLEKVTRKGEEAEIIIKDRHGKIRDNFVEIKNRFDDLISSAEKNYLEKKVVNPEDFMEIFYFISLIFCISPLKKIINSGYRYKFEKNTPILFDENGTEMIKKFYPLTNNTGLFDINCYMYAFFSGIYLIGVPNKAAHYDGLFGCPIVFFQHDINHSFIEFENEDIKKFKKLYIDILSNEDFIQEEKELHVLTMWYIIHELNEGISIYSKKDEIMKDIDDAFVKDFSPDFKRFSKFVIDSETNYFSYKQSLIKYMDYNRSGMIEIVNKLNKKEFNDFIKKDFIKKDFSSDYYHDRYELLYNYLLCYLSFEYSINQISSTFPDLLNEIDDDY